MVNIDKSLCVGCGACTEVCCVDALNIRGGKAVVAGNTCIGCGHCMAVCPRNAIWSDGWDKSQIIPYRRDDFAIDSDKFLNFLKFRRSCRIFTEEIISEEELSLVLEAGRYAPTGGNKQTNRFVVAQNNLDDLKKTVWTSLGKYARRKGLTGVSRRADEYIDSTADKDRLFFGAGTVIFIISKSAIDGGIAAATMELMANSIGLGALYSGYTVRACEGNAELEEYLGIVGAEKLCACLILGHPDVSYRRTVYRKEINVTRK